MRDQELERVAIQSVHKTNRMLGRPAITDAQAAKEIREDIGDTKGGSTILGFLKVCDAIMESMPTPQGIVLGGRTM
jgi:hypothetical protein